MKLKIFNVTWYSAWWGVNLYSLFSSKNAAGAVISAIGLVVLGFMWYLAARSIVRTCALKSEPDSKPEQIEPKYEFNQSTYTPPNLFQER